MTRVGVFGGMFDPVHHGHLAVARHAVEFLDLDQLLLIPCKLPGHRGLPAASGEQRLRMLELAAADDPRIAADPIELSSEGVSYTVHTLARLRRRQPDARLALVLGIDAFLGLPGWRDPERLFRMAHMLVIARQNLPMDYDMAGRFGGAMAQDPEQMFSGKAGRVLLSPEPAIDASSSAARELLASGKRASVPEPVRAYIREQGLYRGENT